MNYKWMVRDCLDGITVLYYGGCQQGFKFFGDDPEEEKIYVKQEHIDLALNHFGDVPEGVAIDYLRRFYAHSRCLLFANGVWLSETAGYAQSLRYKPGTYLNLRISGLTRFTALTNDADAICVGIDPDGEDLSCRERRIHNITDSYNFTPLSSKSIIIPTQDCYYGDLKINKGKPVYAKNQETVLKFEKPGFLVEYTSNRLDMNKAILHYCEQIVNHKIEIIERAKWTA